MKRTLMSIIIISLLMIAGFFSIQNVTENITKNNMDFGFDFLLTRSGFDIGDSWVQHFSHQAYWHAIYSGIINTFIIAIFGIVFSTFIGILLAIGTKSPSGLTKKISGVYINIFRNIPLLVQILFTYTLLINMLPPVSDALDVMNVFVSNRGVYFPKIPLINQCALIALLIAISSLIHKKKTYPALLIAFGISMILVFSPWELPITTRFGLKNGGYIGVEWMALLMALSMYSASYIAEAIRGGFDAIGSHQYESARALGLNYIQTMRHVILPQAKPIFLPSVLNQYLNLTKNVSLGIAIGYPDFFALTAGTILNQSGRAIECIMIIIIVYSILNAIGTYFIEHLSQEKWLHDV